MDTEIIIRMGERENKNGTPHWKILGHVLKTTLITSKNSPSLEDAKDIFAKAYKEAMADSIRYAPLRCIK
jgi:hypothetical protein